MAVPVIRTTYALDEPTVRALERLAGRWGVSKSEALRRVIRAAEQRDAPSSLSTLDRLQRSMGLTAERAGSWSKEVAAERRATSRRAEG